LITRYFYQRKAQFSHWVLQLPGVWGDVVVSRTVPESIPGGVTGFFSDIFLPTVPWPWGRISP